MSGSRLTLGADMTLTSWIGLQDTGSILDMAGHSLQADQFYFGWGGGTPKLLNSGNISVNNLYVGNGNALTLHPGDSIGTSVTLSNASVLTVVGSAAQTTVLNTTAGVDLQNDWSKLVFDYTGGTTPAATVLRSLPPATTATSIRGLRPTARGSSAPLRLPVPALARWAGAMTASAR